MKPEMNTEATPKRNTRRKRLEALMVFRLREIHAKSRAKGTGRRTRPLAVVETPGQQRAAQVLARHERTATDAEKGWVEITAIVLGTMGRRKTADRKTLAALPAYALVQQGRATGGPEPTEALLTAYRAYERHCALLRRFVQRGAERELKRQEAGAGA